MPENKTIHDLPIAEQTNASDVFETEIPSQLMQSGYASRKVTMSSLENHMLGTEQYETQLSNFPQGSRSVFSALEYARQSGGGGGASVVQKTMAEYTALPSSEKMNGSIYKITDKALIYCLDEEYHAVKEITSADYAQLTSDEKNNGTLYVITDEETTADDIPYSQGVSVADKLDNVPTFDTLTSSDNNKLLGVSVIDGDISVGAVGGISTQTVDGVVWSIRQIGNWYEMWADISVDCNAVTPSSWGSLYVYRNSTSIYNLPIELSKKVLDFSFASGTAAMWTCFYTSLTTDEDKRTTADVIRATTTNSTVIVHKYIKGYV